MSEGFSTIIPHIIFLTIDLLLIISSLFHRVEKTSLGRFVAFASSAAVVEMATLCYLADGLGMITLSNMGLQMAYLVALIFISFAAYHWMMFTVSLLSEWVSFGKVWRFMFDLPIAVALLLVVSNPWTGWLLTISDDHQYFHGSMYFLQFVSPYSYMVLALAVLVKLGFGNGRSHAVKMLLIFLSFFVPTMLLSVVQLKVYAGGYPQMAVSIAVILTYLEQYSIQLSRMKRFRELESINHRLEESLSEQEAQIEEIRDLNAHLEENQSLLEETSAEQEAQIEEIQALNLQLSTNNTKLQDYNDRVRRQLNVISSLSYSYESVYYIEIASRKYLELNKSLLIEDSDQIVVQGDMSEVFREMGKHQVTSKYAESLLEFTNIDTLAARLKDRNQIDFEFYGVQSKWSIGSFICAGRDAEGNATQAIWCVRSINEQKEKELTYHRDLNKLQTMLQASEIGTWQLIDKEGYHPRLVCDPKMKELLGLQADSCISDEDAFDLLVKGIHPDDIAAFQKYDAELRMGHVAEVTYRWVNPELGERYVRCGGGSVMIKDGFILSGYHRDVTEMALKEKELQLNIEANKAKTKFLQNMSHEIRTPLNAMFGFSQLLGMPDGMWSEEEKAQYNTYIYNSYNMLDMLISDILDSADSENGNYRIEMSEVNVNDACRNAMMTVEFRRPAAVEMKFTSDLDDDYSITSDARRIQQVLVNYLTNACKFTVRGEIHLHCSKSEKPGRLTLSVTDTGKGVPIEKADEIFGRFTKLNEHIQGSGLGLNICHTIATKLGGEVYLDTTYTGGARFVFVIDDNPTTH